MSLGTGALCALLLGASLILSGCTGRPSAEQALQRALDQAGLKKESVFTLAGRLMIDGQPPAFDPRCAVVVVLVDAERKDDRKEVQRQPHRFVECGPEGKFSFSTYARDDGVQPGHYIVVFAKLSRLDGSYYSPDQLHNLFNDPDKNALKPEFVIEHRSPGKSDYEFHLEVTGVDPIETAGPHAVTSLP
jgi:hypothetical protein